MTKHKKIQFYKDMQDSSAWTELTSFIEEMKNDLQRNVDLDKPNQSHFTLAQIKTLEEFKNLPIIYANEVKREVELEEALIKQEEENYLKGKANGR